MKKNFVVIDAYGFLFRAYYALPNFSTSYGFPIGGVYGFIKILLKNLSAHVVDYLVVVFDSGEKNFRHDLYPQYKTNRAKLPDELLQQFAPLREAVAAFSIASEEVVDYEADDVIATLSAKYASDDVEVRIFTADKDLLQLLDENVVVYDPIKGRYLDNEYVLEKFGVPANKLCDTLSLTGDSSDNVPGVPGIGVKTAAKLIDEFGTLDSVLRNAEHVRPKRWSDMLLQHADKALLSRDLVSLVRDVKLDGTLEKYIRRSPDKSKLLAFLEKYELISLHSKIEKHYRKAFSEELYDDASGPDDSTELSVESGLENLKGFLEQCYRKGVVSVCIRADGGKIVEMMLSHDGSTMFVANGDNIHAVLDGIIPMMRSDAVLKVVFDTKAFFSFFDDIVAVDDIMIMSYALDAGNHDHSISSISRKHLQSSETKLPEVCVLLKLHQIMKRKILEEKLCAVYYALDRPLMRILYNMQQVGIEVDVELLQQLSENFTCHIKKFEREIYEIAGCEFNIASSKQLGQVLFEHMSLNRAKKTPSGVYCTNAEVLIELAMEGEEIADKILGWRHYTKLRSTYTDAILKQIKGVSRRVHTSYSLIATVTGRVSSSNPGLQNIPVRSKEGEEIRRAFVAKPGCKLIAADYSQMELKVLAHIADVQSFRRAFAEGQDIHLVTARQIFGDNASDPDFRRRAKSINFGIIYGMSIFGLARNIGIGHREASVYVEQYFRSYPEIRQYMETTKAYAHEHGYTTTAFGRKCFIKGINSSQNTVRNVAERAAINAPIQGTAADVVKKAMIRISERLPYGSLVLQVHDELVFEVPEEHVYETAHVIKSVMENVVEFAVPLDVDISIGDNWGEMEKVEMS